METIPEALPEIDYPKSISENSSDLARGKRDSYQDSEIKSIFPETSPKSVRTRKFGVQTLDVALSLRMSWTMI